MRTQSALLDDRSFHAENKSMGVTVMRTPKTGMNERARDFALKVTEYQPRKLAARNLGIAPDTVKAIRSYHTPGKRLLQRWKAKFGKPFEDFINGEHDNAELAALRAQREELNRRIEALEK